MERLRGKCLTGSQIKWIAICAMLIDHIAWGFVPTYSALGQVMHVIGRITAPTMCFFISEGYAHTRNVGRYALRLGVFAVLSQVPFTFFETGKVQIFSPKAGCSVIYTLFLSLLAIWAFDAVRNKALKWLAVIGLCILAIPGDWMFMDVIFSLIFWKYRDDADDRNLLFVIIAAGMVICDTILYVLNGQPAYGQIFQAGVLLCLPILFLYNGERGGGKNSKWVFYIFYPAHLLVLGIIKMLL